LLAGGFTLAVGLAAVLVMVRSRSRWMRRTAVLGVVPVAVVAFLLLGAVTAGQREACGDLLAACESLLPGP
jgi:4-amino-4-deoxy-L-arabinose transferase-like glycosyltransferase